MVCAKTYEIVSKCVKVMTKNKVAPFYLGQLQLSLDVII